MIDSHQPITTDEFLERVKNGQKVFEGFSIGEFSFTVKGVNLDDLVFHNSCIESSFELCSFKGTVFSGCRVKTITFENCNMSGACILECSVEAVQINNCILDGFVFGTNYAYGCNLKDYSRLKTPTGFSF